MAYTINKTDGTVVATVEDGVLDTTTTLQLIGRNYQSYGEPFNENLVKLQKSQQQIHIYRRKVNLFIFKIYKLNKEIKMDIIVSIIAFGITTAVLVIAFKEMG